MCTERTIIQPLWTVLKLFQSPRGDPSHWSGFWSWSEPLIWIMILIRATYLDSDLDPSHWSGFWSWSEALILIRATDLDSDLDPSHWSELGSWSEPLIWIRIFIRATDLDSDLDPSHWSGLWSWSEPLDSDPRWNLTLIHALHCSCFQFLYHHSSFHLFSQLLPSLIYILSTR